MPHSHFANIISVLPAGSANTSIPSGTVSRVFAVIFYLVKYTKLLIFTGGAWYEQRKWRNKSQNTNSVSQWSKTSSWAAEQLLKVHTPGHLKQSGYDEMFRVELFRSATEVHKHTKNGKEYTKESSPNDKDISNVSSFSFIHS